MNNDLITTAGLTTGHLHHRDFLNALITEGAKGRLRFTDNEGYEIFVPIDDAPDVVEDADAISLTTYDEAEQPLQVLAIVKTSDGLEPVEPTMLLSMIDDPARKLAVYTFFDPIPHADFERLANELSSAGFDLVSDCPIPGAGCQVDHVTPDAYGDPRGYLLEDIATAFAPTLWNDAVLHGEVSETILNSPVEIARGNSAKQLRGWKTTESSFGQLLERLTRHEVSGSKDGPAILQGSLKGGQRTKKAVDALYIVELDLDRGDDIDRVKARLRELGLFALIYSTYNHRTSETSVSHAAVVTVRPMSYTVFVRRAEKRMLGLRDKLREAPFLKEHGLGGESLEPKQLFQDELNLSPRTGAAGVTA